MTKKIINYQLKVIIQIMTSTDNTVFQLHTGYVSCNSNHNSGAVVAGYNRKKHSVIYRRNSRKCTPTHELLHSFCAKDHQRSWNYTEYNSCIMSYNKDDNVLYNNMLTGYQNSESFLCDDCILLLQMSRHYVARVGE